MSDLIRILRAEHERNVARDTAQKQRAEAEMHRQRQENAADRWEHMKDKFVQTFGLHPPDDVQHITLGRSWEYDKTTFVIDGIYFQINHGLRGGTFCRTRKYQRLLWIKSREDLARVVANSPLS